MTLGAFACVLAMQRNGRNVESISDLSALAKTNLTFATILAVLMFSLAGIPPLAGFWAKWYVFLPAIKAGLDPLSVIGVVTSVVGAYYDLRVVKIMFFDEPLRLLADGRPHVCRDGAVGCFCRGICPAVRRRNRGRCRNRCRFGARAGPTL